MHTPRRAECGFSMIECLVAVALLSVTALAVTHSTVQSMVLAKRNMRNSMATQLALSKIEEYAAMDPESYTAANSVTGTSIVFDDVTFTRSIAITVNSDSSRTVQVTVRVADASLGGDVTFKDTFPLWGNK